LKNSLVIQIALELTILLTILIFCSISFILVLAPRIRLSNANANTGHIIIHDGRTWRSVVEENWDKNRQKMLCQHLGFEETADNKIVIKQLKGGNDIATGDFICHNSIQSSGTSCCIHLQPSKPPRETTSQFPDVQCKCIGLSVAGSKFW
jgi:hypothetical protein